MLPYRLSRMVPLLACLLLAPLVTGCESTRSAGVPRGAAAYEVIPSLPQDATPEYRLGPRDALAITVFKEPDLTFNPIQIDAGGNLSYPLIGTVRASGLTATQLAATLRDQLNARFLRNAQVSVVVVQSISQTVTVEGQVTSPGVFEITNAPSLLQAIALAKSPTRTARLNEVIVFRQQDGQRVAARFDLRDIRAGRAPDPTLRGGDVVVVGYSALSGAFRDALLTAPFFNIFTRF